MENGPEMKMYVLLKMVIFQPAMLVYQRLLVLLRYDNGSPFTIGYVDFCFRLCPFFFTTGVIFSCDLTGVKKNLATLQLGKVVLVTLRLYDFKFGWFFL